MFDLGIQELIVIFVVALIVFGPKRLPELGRTLGKGILELKKAMEGVKEQIHTETEMIQREVQSPKEEKKQGAEERPKPEAGSSSSPDPGKSKEEKHEIDGASETDKFYRSEEERSAERKEGPVDGR